MLKSVIEMMIAHEPNLHKSSLFACLDLDLHLERIAGGNESEVYLTDDSRFVVKLKNEPYSSPNAALNEANALRAAAQNFANIIGQEHSTPSYFLITGDDDHHSFVVIVQPYLDQSQPLFYIDYASLEPKTRKELASQLQEIISRSLRSYLRTGIIPDIYGLSAASPEERARRKKRSQIPARLWSFFIRRTLMRSHNLLWTPEEQVRLIDYDPVRRSPMYKRAYYSARAMLFFRDLFFIWIMKHTGWAY
ncbi:MAG: hypothetical protein AAGD96_22175 [Chloroflexota bacterium]